MKFTRSPVHLFFWLVVLGLLAVACRQDELLPTGTPSTALTMVTAVPSPYPVPTFLAPFPEAYPAATEAAAYPVVTEVVATATSMTDAAPTLSASVPTLPPQDAPNPETGSEIYLPVVIGSVPETAAQENSTATPIAPLDFAALQTQLQDQGLALAYNKIGFHAGINGTMEGLEAWMRQLDAAGVPFFLKTTDNAEPVYIAQELMKQSGVPHTLVYRRVAGGDDYNVPFYDLPPEEAARIHWQKHIETFPPELDPNLIWMETINEVDKNRSEWLAQFALATAQMALRDGYKWAAFGWASGEPEPADWQSPAMLEFLRLAAANPDRIAIAVHEYSYTLEEIGHEYPYKIGRFQELFRICDQYGIPRPTVLITEWGWTHEKVPPPDKVVGDIAWAANLYAQYPQVKGAAIWYLGGGYGDIATQTQRLIQPLTVFSLQNYFTMPPPPAQAAIEPERYAP